MNENGIGGDVISLEELWRLLVRRRHAALLALFGVAVAAGLYLVLANPLFESSASFYIGAARGSLLAEPTLLSQRIKREFGKEARPGSSAWVAEINTDRREPRLLVLKTRGTSAEETFQLAAEIVKSVTSENAAELKETSEAAETELRELKELAGMARNALTRIKARDAATEKPAANAPDILYSTVQLGAMIARIGELEQSLRTRFVPTELVQPPVLPKRPVHPETKKVVGFALFGGLTLALVAAFLAEAMARRWRE